MYKYVICFGKHSAFFDFLSHMIKLMCARKKIKKRTVLNLPEMTGSTRFFILTRAHISFKIVSQF